MNDATLVIGGSGFLVRALVQALAGVPALGPSD